MQRNANETTPRLRNRRRLGWPILTSLLFLLVLAGCPEPDPVPPPPPPPPPVEGLRVLIVEETDDRDNLPAEQVDIFSNQVLRDWLAESCLNEGGLPAFRFLDVSNDVSRLPQIWQDWFAKAGTAELPTMIAVGPGGEYSGPLPADAEAVLKKLIELKGGE